MTHGIGTLNSVIQGLRYIVTIIIDILPCRGRIPVFFFFFHVFIYCKITTTIVLENISIVIVYRGRLVYFSSNFQTPRRNPDASVAQTFLGPSVCNDKKLLLKKTSEFTLKFIAIDQYVFFFFVKKTDQKRSRVLNATRSRVEYVQNDN